MIKRVMILNSVSLLIGLLAVGVAHASEAAEEEGMSPLSVAGAETISVEQAHELFLAAVPFVDVRNPRLFARRHIPNAVHLDLQTDFNLSNLASFVARDAPFVVYCSGVKCSRSSTAVEFAVEWGFTQAKYFREGIVGWRDADLPLVEAQ